MKPNHIQYHVGVLIIMLLISVRAEAINWQVVTAEDPADGGNTCLLQTPTQEIDDGQTRTPVSIVYNGQVFFIVTKSNIDISYQDTGLTVDSKATHAIAYVHKAKIAAFAEDAANIHQEFIKGRTVRVALGFWPTWPKTKTRIAEFSLLGYTDAYRQFEQCKQSAANN